MLQIIVMILKILGILLLAILGIILVLLLAVLFVPVRYRIDVSFEGEPKGNVLVSWFLHLITARIRYEGSLNALVKVLWFHLFDKKLWPSEEEADSLMDESMDTLDGFDAAEEPPVYIEQPKVSNTQPETEKNRIQEPKPEPKVSRVQETKPEPAASKKQERVIPEKAQGIPEPEHTDEPEPLLRKLACKIADVMQKTVQKITSVYQNLCGKVQNGQDKIASVRAFLTDEENQKTLKLLLRQVRKMIVHILPRKIKGRVRFGFDDPAATGQVLTYISPFYGMYAKTLQIEPVFDQKTVEGELHIKGHIRAAVLLWIVVRVLFNKNFRKLLKKFMAKGKQ